MARVKGGLRRLRASGFAPAFIYVFDEAWLLLERSWRLLGRVLLQGTHGARVEEAVLEEAAVLEPAINAHVLASACAEGSQGADEGAHGGEISRHTTIGGAFPMPHRDHSTMDCFDQARGGDGQMGRGGHGSVACARSCDTNAVRTRTGGRACARACPASFHVACCMDMDTEHAARPQVAQAAQ